MTQATGGWRTLLKVGSVKSRRSVLGRSTEGRPAVTWQAAVDDNSPSSCPGLQAGIEGDGCSVPGTTYNLENVSKVDGVCCGAVTFTATGCNCSGGGSGVFRTSAAPLHGSALGMTQAAGGRRTLLNVGCVKSRCSVLGRSTKGRPAVTWQAAVYNDSHPTGPRSMVAVFQVPNTTLRMYLAGSSG